MNKITKVKMASVATTDLYDLQPAEKLIAKHEVLSYLYHCTFGGAQLIIDEGVFCPTLTNASPLLLKAIDFKSSDRVLDVFSGSGVFGIIAAMHDAQNVVTVDTSAQAATCTKANARLNNVSKMVEAREGTLNECVMAGLVATSAIGTDVGYEKYTVDRITWA